MRMNRLLYRIVHSRSSLESKGLDHGEKTKGSYRNDSRIAINELTMERIAHSYIGCQSPRVRRGSKAISQRPQGHLQVTSRSDLSGICRVMECSHFPGAVAGGVIDILKELKRQYGKHKGRLT